ncbi:hypothetical protein LSTR_LSTR013859 [Laodelphax striatellus]|uniref:MYND-type domain-containing protein n=1 Tax=Laodelphax striatellus TaxID=195883 RepID=A0A482X015_LAOST|nr:hypothetical protein LSTR_LSTR013859 [Laodelphax striatellus]
MSDNKCAVCSQPARQLCGGCKTVFYCSREHQRADWKQRHKHQCSCYKVVASDTLGRHLVATRDIKAGEVIIKEPPLVVGPKLCSVPTCLGCHKTLQATSPDDETPANYYKCSGCGWPLCAPRCESLPQHKQECELMCKNGFTSTITYQNSPKPESAYCVILPLRCLLLDKPKFEQFMNLESHLETRKNTPLYRMLNENLVGFIKQVLELPFDPETILKVAAILDTNAFEIRKMVGKVKVRGLYLKAAMLSHDCVPNTKHIYVDDDFKIVITATEDIRKGDVITTTYTQTLWGTLARRSHLRGVKCFSCSCARCADPTELGLYLGCILCSKCGAKLVSVSPLQDTAEWKCEKCSHKIAARQMIAGNESIKRELDGLKSGGIDGLEQFIAKYSDSKSVLHATNSHLLQAKHALSQLYGNCLQKLTEEQVKLQIRVCEELLEVADTLEPGITRFRGLLLYDLQAARLVNIKNEFENENITGDEAQAYLAEPMKILGEATEILRTEPDLLYLLEDKMKEISELCSF